MQATPGYFDDVQEFTPIFEDGTYTVTVVRIEASDAGQYGPGLKWILNLTSHATGEQVLLPNSNEAYEFFQFSSRKVTPRTKVYPWLAAFLGRPLQIGESGSELVNAVLGKSAIAMIGVPADDASGRQKILSIKAMPAGGAAPRPTRAPAAEPAPKYTAQGEPIESDDDEDELLAKLEAARARKGAANRAKAGVSDETYKAIFVEELPL